MKNLIDYAYQDNGTDFRKELYAAIHDKVAAAIEGKKQEIASNFMGQQEESVEEFVELDEVKYASGEWHVIDNKDGGHYKNTIHSTHSSARKAINAARKANEKDPEGDRYHAKAASAITNESVEESVELDEAKVSPTRGTRKIAAYHGEGGHTAEVRYSPEWKEYQVHHYKNGIHQGEGPISYHGHDKEDAHSTAKYECGIQPAVTKK